MDGVFEEYPKPKNFKLTKNQLYPDKGVIFDYVFDKKNGGAWINWTDVEKDFHATDNTKVRIICKYIMYVVLQIISALS